MAALQRGRVEEEVDIVVVRWDVDTKQAQAGLARAFGLQAKGAERLLHGLPAVAKRKVPRSIADRYVKALRAIGAQVQLERSVVRAQPSIGPSRSASLPAPGEAGVALEASEDEVVARFRASAGLDREEPPTAEALNPLIPRAPLLPHDLSRMPNARHQPAEAGGLSLDDPEGEPSFRPRHTDAQLPPPVFLDQDGGQGEPSAGPSIEQAVAGAAPPSEPIEERAPTDARKRTPLPTVDGSADAPASPHRARLLGAIVLAIVVAIALAAQWLSVPK